MRIIRSAQLRKISPLAEVGKVKIGERKMGKNGKEYPCVLDYFKGYGPYARLFNDAMGKEPKILPIIFFSDDIGISCSERYEIRDSAGKLFADGDGERFRVFDGEKYKPFCVSDYPSMMNDIEKKVGSLWQEVLTLRFIIPKIRGISGCWSLTTKGKESSISQIVATFDFVKKMAGTVCHLPMDLQISIVKSQAPGRGRVFPVLKLIPNITNDRLLDVKEFLDQGADINTIPSLLNNYKSDLLIENK